MKQKNRYPLLVAVLMAFGMSPSYAQVNESDGEVLRAKEVINDEKPSAGQGKVFDVVEQMPEFPGGQAALLKWLNGNLRYPPIAEENGIQGRVICTFIIEPDGSVTDMKVARSVDPSLDKEAVRVLEKMPRWIPGKQGGSPVRVKYTVPVTFRLDGGPQPATSPAGATGSAVEPFLLKSGELQDLTKSVFQKLIKGRRSESLSFDLQYMKDRNVILNHCIPFFFDDEVTDSFDEALNRYLQSLGKEKKSLKEVDVEKKYRLSVLDNIQGKYVSFIAEVGIIVKKGKITTRDGQAMAFLYDVPNDRILSLNDILKPQYAEAIMNSGFSNHLTLSHSALVWGQKAGNSIHLNKIDFLNGADHFTDEFKQQVGLDAEIAAYRARLSEKAQEVTEDTRTPDGATEVFDVVEQMPEFAPSTYKVNVYDEKGNIVGVTSKSCPGGQMGLMRFIADNLRYPPIAEENGIQGRVVCSFIVDRDGSIKDVHVIRSVDPSLDREAVRVLEKMPRWNPGKQKGSPVRVKYTVPVTFRLR